MVTFIQTEIYWSLVSCFLLGIMLGRMGPNGSALVNFCQSLNEAVLKIVAIVIW